MGACGMGALACGCLHGSQSPAHSRMEKELLLHPSNTQPLARSTDRSQNRPQAATKVSSEDAARLKELSGQLSNEMLALAKLRASCSGLQKKAAEIQVLGVDLGRGLDLA